MIFEGGQGAKASPNDHQEHCLMDWLEEPMCFISSFLDDPCAAASTSTPNEITSCEWWAKGQEQYDMTCTTPSLSSTPSTANSPQLLPQAEFSRKRKKPTSSTTGKTTAAIQDKQRTVGVPGKKVQEELVEEGEVNMKLAGTGRKVQGKGGPGASSNGGSKETRWAEKLLNPCATAIEAANVSRVRHLLCVLQELQSLSGDVNHRLAAYGLRALVNRLLFTGISISNIGGAAAATTEAAVTFVTSETRLFRSALIKFHEVSPWFALPNALANASILQTLARDPSRCAKSLRVVDVGVSHGLQWPTFLDAIARRPEGGPPLVRLTVAGAAAPPGPFSVSPPGYDFRSHLLRYAKSINLNLQIDDANDLEPSSLALRRDETLVICTQFRICHRNVDDRMAFLRSMRKLEPDLLVLSEIEGGRCSGGADNGYPAAFAKKAELLWRFLDSTSAAFRGKDCSERRVMEGEAARVLETAEPAAEGRERWQERMAAAGFEEEAFGEEAMEAGKAILRKCDGNWEMRTASPAAAEAVALWWKGQPVSFCSLWKPNRPM
ncbi:protein NODULATION SIGNALING PATHWAY 1-like [Zingiber officinale]|uniref:Nodulation signaling pathway 1-like protein n=1 Tax=Zingiber officinale TaxID=94328 RepID=A0A8J5I2T2_ZINOF|nr:protein NODULATION SIGNALING PATHWAY 1-like [Zingiber officinale]KAG6526582.1 hypothetical protein ZIOFF_016573 [Zingiber officinale]